MKYVGIIVLVLSISSCVSVPEGIEPVDDFELSRYLGRWYEIARLDHSFERGLENVSATYSMREDGGVRVLNQGYSPIDKSWRTAEGKAYFVNEKDSAHLKVSFFGPFYGAYVVFYLDEGYQTALVVGPDRSYFWILSRSLSIAEADLKKLLRIAQNKGVNTEKLIYLKHQILLPEATLHE